MDISTMLTSPSMAEGLELYIGYQVASAIVQSLPRPEEVGNNVWYRAFYNFLTILIGDFKSFVKTPFQGTSRETGGEGAGK